MELEKVLRLISDNKDIRPDEFDKILAPALKEEVITVRDILAKRGIVGLGLVTQDPIMINDGCFGWSVKFTIGAGTRPDYTVMVSVYVIAGGKMSHQPNLIVSLTKEDGTCMYSGDWTYPKDGMPCMKCVILEAIGKAGIAWYGVQNDKTTTVKQPVADTKEWFFLEFWKHDNTLRAVYHNVDLSALKELWLEQNNHCICTPIMKGLWPTMENSNEHP